MKKYKSNEDLINYIISKGVTVTNKGYALDKIKKYSYYSIVNTYKDVFKNLDNNYKKNVTFEEIYSLYEFDKNIRSIFLTYILEVETVIKSLLAELLSSKYSINNYLLASNFDTNINPKIIQDNIDKINEEINKQNGKHEAITHYINKYGFVPPFVLIKILTWGELSRLYSMLKQTDRQTISKEFKVPDNFLKQVMKNITMIRNICAHNDRMFSFHSKFLITFKIIDSNYNNKDNSTNVYMIMKSMQRLLDKDKSDEFERLINLEIEKLKKNIKSVDINLILYLMGFFNE